MILNDRFNIGGCIFVSCQCVSAAEVPRRGLHHQIRHPRGGSLAHRRSLVVQDEDLVLTDLCHKVEVLL